MFRKTSIRQSSSKLEKRNTPKRLSLSLRGNVKGAFNSTNGKKLGNDEKIARQNEMRLEEEEAEVAVIEESKQKLAAGDVEISRLVFIKPASDTATFFAKEARKLIEATSFKFATNQNLVDIVKDVINPLPIHWISCIVRNFSTRPRFLVYTVYCFLAWASNKIGK